MKLQLPCCYFPTRIVLIDDIRAFSDSVSFHLPAEVKIFDHAVKALEFLQGYEPEITENIWLQSDTVSELADGSYRQPLMINTHQIKSIYKCHQRYQDISVLIVDYHMPDLNGLELLQKLENKSFKKLLLTGEGDNALAVKAFNEGLIDYFLRKDESHLHQKIDSAIKNLQREYFIDMSQKSREILESQLPLFSEPQITHYFYEKIVQNNIQEFYLMNMQGNYLLIDQQKNKRYFCAYTENQLKTFADYSAQDNAASHIITDLKQGNKIPFFGEEKIYWEIEANKWNVHLYPADIIETAHHKFSVNIVNAV